MTQERRHLPTPVVAEVDASGGDAGGGLRGLGSGFGTNGLGLGGSFGGLRRETLTEHGTIGKDVAVVFALDGFDGLLVF